MRKLVQWFVDNPIAANLLMVCMLVGGVFSARSIEKEVFPSNTESYVFVDAYYPGAAPSEVEQQIVVRIEEAVADLVGVFRVTSKSSQAHGRVTIEVIDGYDVKAMLNDVKARVDSINTFPQSMERPIVSQNINRVPLTFFSLYGEADPKVMKAIAYQIRDEMSVLEGVSQVNIMGQKSDELGIEISEQTLRAYQLSFDEVAAAIRNASINLPAGTIRSNQGDIQVQTRAQAFDAEDFARVVVRSYDDGSQLLLGDIAEIKDEFAEQNLEFFYNGERGLDFEVLISDEPDLFAGTRNARAYIENLAETLPEGMNVYIDWEMKNLYDSRFQLLTSNALSGLVLVFLVLMLFLRPALAMWVVAGIATAFAGALWALPYADISLNMLSLFAFILVLGIVVDDAIIVGESIYTHQQNGMKGNAASTIGANMVLKPVFLAVASTVIFFLPMVTVPPDVAPYSLSIFYVVLFSLAFSLIESLLILPSHLSHLKPEKVSRFAALRGLKRLRERFSGGLQHVASRWYLPALHLLLKRKVSTFLGFSMAFFLALAVMTGGWIKSSFNPDVPQSFIIANVSYPEGAPFSKTQETAHYIADLANTMRTDEQLLEQNRHEPFLTEIKTTANGSTATVFMGLVPSENRKVSVETVTNRLRELIGPMPEAQRYSLAFTFDGETYDIELNMNILANDRDSQQAAVDEVTRVLSAYPGVINVRSDLETERVEVELNIKPYAETLGITLGDIARQVRQSFYGEEIQRIPRAKEDVRVMLRYPASERSKLDTLSNMWVRAQDGTEIPLEAVADVQLVPGFTTIRRADRKRNITLTANVEEGYDANAIIDEMLTDFLPQWKRDMVGFNVSKEGNLRSQTSFRDNLGKDFVRSVVIILVILAIAFRSLFQPLLVILAVPFGFMGAVFGHLVMDTTMSIMSFFGFLACAGVVVNDNLVLLDRINQIRHRGETAFNAVVQAGADRFRPIVLTSITTFVGLLPILFERSEQAQFLKPTVVALAFGVLLASTVTLFLVPACYLIGHSAGERFARLKARIGFGGHEADDELSAREKAL